MGLMAGITGTDDEDKTDRLKTKLRTLILTCLGKFDSWVDYLERGSGCRCANIDPIERKRGRHAVFDMGEKKCGANSRCQIEQFLAKMSDSASSIRKHLATATETAGRPQQLSTILEFLNDATVPGFNTTDRNPCLTVGDLLIALESVAANCDEMYTMNHRDSRPLCAALGQRLRILSHKPETPDEVISSPS